MFEVLLYIRRLVAYSALSTNLCGPMLNTTYSNFCKDGFIYTIGIQFFFLQYIIGLFLKCKEKLNIASDILLKYNEDERKTIQLAT